MPMRTNIESGLLRQNEEMGGKYSYSLFYECKVVIHLDICMDFFIKIRSRNCHLYVSVPLWNHVKV